MFSEIMKKFGHLFDIVEEPEYSKQKILGFQKKYPNYSYEYMNWLYSIQGFKNEVLNFVPEFEDWIYYNERFSRYGGVKENLKCFDSFEDTQNVKNDSCCIYKEEDGMPSSYFCSLLLCIIVNFDGLQIISDISRPYFG